MEESEERLLEITNEHLDHYIYLQKRLAAWIKDHTWITKGDPLFILRLKEKFTTEQIVIFLEIMDSCCRSCWDNNRGCFCDRDD